MKKINDWVIRTFGLRGSWSWAKKQMLNGAIIKRKATIGTYKIAIDNDKNRLLVATWDHLDQSPVWERCPHSLLDEDAVDYFVTAHKELSYGGIIDGLDIDEGATSYWTSTQYNYEKAWLVTYNGNEFYPNDERKIVSFYAIRVISQLR